MAAQEGFGLRRGQLGLGPDFSAAFGSMFLGGWQRLRRGDVRPAILALLREGPMHGYRVMQELSRRSGGRWRPSPGSVYPTLQQLEDEGLVRSEEDDGKRVYHLTPSGVLEAPGKGEQPSAPWELIGEEEPAFSELRDLFVQLGVAMLHVAFSGNRDQVASAREILDRSRRDLYRALAEHFPADPGSEQAR